MNTETKLSTRLGDQITSEEMQLKIADVLPKYLTAEQFTRVMAGQLSRNPKLGECTRVSIFNALMTCAQAGLLPDGRNAHLIPFFDRQKEETICTVIFDYKGLIAVAAHNGVRNIRAFEIRKNDELEYAIEDATMKFRWKPNLFADRGEIIAFGATSSRDGITDVEIMTKAEVDAIRKRSKASNAGPWVTDYAEMGKKTVLRRMSKRWPLGVEAARALEEESLGEAVEPEKATGQESPTIGRIEPPTPAKPPTPTAKEPELLPELTPREQLSVKMRDAKMSMAKLAKWMASQGYAQPNSISDIDDAIATLIVNGWGDLESKINEA